jgi:polysaccharide pyruvyl transferase WcaK-like protein
MIIELKGINVKNKGAYLMLKAILAKVRERYPDAVIVSEKGYGLTKNDLDSQGMKQKFMKNGKGKKEKLISVIPQPFRKTFGLITTDDVDVVLEGSGFLYGDGWDVTKINKRIVNELDIYKSKNAKVILMPQAFGPFTEKNIRESLAKVTDRADLVFARDTVSFVHLTENFGKKQNIIQAPDFTNLLKPNKKDYNTKPYEDGILVIPNFKMNTLKGLDVSETYLNLLQTTIEVYQKLNENVFLLNHEGELDQQIAEKVNERLTNKVQIIKVEDPLYIKAIIGVAKIVVTSRFHGLVSSLSQAVPTLCTSWSHKYQMLMNEYGQADYLIDVLNTNQTDLEQMLLSIHDEANLKQIRKTLSERSLHFAGLSEQMWNRVFDCIEQK